MVSTPPKKLGLATQAGRSILVGWVLGPRGNLSDECHLSDCNLVSDIGNVEESFLDCLVGDSLIFYL